jgi:hypothetical protein
LLRWVGLSVSGKASVRNYAFSLEGSPSLADGGPNGVVLAGLPTAVAGGIVIKVHAKYSLFPGSTSMVPGFSDHHFRHLFSFHGLAAVVHGDKLWVGNKNGASRNCAEGFLLDGANGTAAAWPLDTLALIAVTVGADGRIQSVLADDTPLRQQRLPRLWSQPPACRWPYRRARCCSWAPAEMTSSTTTSVARCRRWPSAAPCKWPLPAATTTRVSI